MEGELKWVQEPSVGISVGGRGTTREFLGSSLDGKLGNIMRWRLIFIPTRLIPWGLRTLHPGLTLKPGKGANVKFRTNRECFSCH